MRLSCVPGEKPARLNPVKTGRLPELAAMPTYLNTAAFGLIDPAVKAQADSFYTELAQTGSTVAEHWRDEIQPRIRQRLASFLGAPESQVAMIPNFSWGLNALVHSLRGSERISALR